jgi:alpha-D-ribose 1-methylphosphonate 5-triphosphate synthase subunit PhnL
VAARDIVAEPLVTRGVDREAARADAEALLARLNLPGRLWDLPPATFSGGEQQRINVARGFIARYPLLLLDEPTASLDAANRGVVVEMIGEAKAAGASFLGIFHDEGVRNAVADRVIDVTRFTPAAA